jgi:CubicO group peptidase (beta-lactamase class C family)
MTRRLTVVSALVGVAIALAQPGSAQSQLPYSLFERYLDALRQQSNIPGLSAAIVKDGRIEWERGFGYQDVDRSIAAEPDTPYPIGGLSQSFGAVLLGICAERGQVNIDDLIRRWSPEFRESSATLRHVLAHASEGAPAGHYHYDPGAYAQLTPAVQSCSGRNYRQALADQILERLAMTASVPGADLANDDSAAVDLFDDGRIERYRDVLRRVAVPYRIDRNTGRATRNDQPVRGAHASDGIISTVRDLASFDAALGDGVLLRRETLGVAWTPANFGTQLPTGLGWFVQSYQGEKLVWHFSHVPDASSALVLKMPQRGITLILLANSDGLTTGANLEEGDVTASPFVKIFLRLFV